VKGAVDVMGRAVGLWEMGMKPKLMSCPVEEAFELLIGPELVVPTERVRVEALLLLLLLPEPMLSWAQLLEVLYAAAEEPDGK
jgi:hypothetical protein